MTDNDLLKDEVFSLSTSVIEEIQNRGRTDKSEFIPSPPISEEIDPNESKLLRTACGMANTNGGYILLGVDSDGDPVGLEDPDNVDEIASDLLDRHIDEVDDFVYSTSGVKMQEGFIVGIKIEESGPIPVALEGKFFRRDRDKNTVLTPIELWRRMPSNADVSD